MTRDEFASAITPLVRHGLTVAAGFLAARGFTGATDLVSSFTSSGVLLLATVAWSLLEKNKLVAAAIDQIPASSLEQVSNTVSELKKAGGDPLLIAHIAQAVTALANSELAIARPDLVPAGAPAPVVAAPVVVAPETPPAVVSQPSEQAPLAAAPVAEPAPVLADGSLPQ